MSFEATIPLSERAVDGSPSPERQQDGSTSGPGAIHLQDETLILPLTQNAIHQSPDSETKATDESLIEEICGGSREALAFLFRRHARMVRGIAQRILRDEAEAEDLLQDVFLFVFGKAALYDRSKASARSWLVQITYHRAFDRRRYLNSRHFYTRRDLEEVTFQAEETEAVTSFYETTIEGTLGKETLQRIHALLSEDQRRVLQLHFFEGHTLAEIAVLLGQTSGNVRNHYYRALEKMRREIFTPKLQPE